MSIRPIKGVTTDSYDDNTIRLNASNVDKNVMISNLDSANVITVQYGIEINEESNPSTLDVPAGENRYIDLSTIGTKFLLQIKSTVAGASAKFKINAVGV